MQQNRSDWSLWFSQVLSNFSAICIRLSVNLWCAVWGWDIYIPSQHVCQADVHCICIYILYIHTYMLEKNGSQWLLVMSAQQTSHPSSSCCIKKMNIPIFSFIKLCLYMYSFCMCVYTLPLISQTLADKSNMCVCVCGLVLYCVRMCVCKLATVLGSKWQHPPLLVHLCLKD